MRSLYAALICICVLLSYTGNAFAQEVEAKKVEGHTWHQLIMVWTMDSIEDMNWEMTPDDIKGWEQMVEQEGSEEKALELMRNFSRYDY